MKIEKETENTDEKQRKQEKNKENREKKENRKKKQKGEKETKKTVVANTPNNRAGEREEMLEMGQPSTLHPTKNLKARRELLSRLYDPLVNTLRAISFGDFLGF